MTQFFSELPEELSDPEGSVAEAEYIDSLLALGEELKKLVQQLEVSREYSVAWTRYGYS